MGSNRCLERGGGQHIKIAGMTERTERKGKTRTGREKGLEDTATPEFPFRSAFQCGTFIKVSLLIYFYQLPQTFFF